MHLCTWWILCRQLWFHGHIFLSNVLIDQQWKEIWRLTALWCPQINRHLDGKFLLPNVLKTQPKKPTRKLSFKRHAVKLPQWDPQSSTPTPQTTFQPRAAVLTSGWEQNILRNGCECGLHSCSTSLFFSNNHFNTNFKKSKKRSYFLSRDSGLKNKLEVASWSPHSPLTLIKKRQPQKWAKTSEQIRPL